MAVLLIHGGAGGDGPWGGPTDLDSGRIDCMNIVLQSVGSSLEKGSIDALEAVSIAVQVLENEPLYNAGIGSVLDSEGNISMDASIMRGSDGAAGACACVTNVKSPISLAKRLLEKGWPLMMVGEGAEKFADDEGIELARGKQGDAGTGDMIDPGLEPQQQQHPRNRNKRTHNKKWEPAHKFCHPARRCRQNHTRERSERGQHCELRRREARIRQISHKCQ